MNDHELARKLARETGTLLIGLRNHAASLSGGEDETHSVLAEEVLGSEGDRVAHDYLMDQFSIHRPSDVVVSEEGDLEVARLNATRVWIIDPLDGTAQYSTGGDDFAVLQVETGGGQLLLKGHALELRIGQLRAHFFLVFLDVLLQLQARFEDALLHPAAFTGVLGPFQHHLRKQPQVNHPPFEQKPKHLKTRKELYVLWISFS